VFCTVDFEVSVSAVQITLLSTPVTEYYSLSVHSIRTVQSPCYLCKYMDHAKFGGKLQLLRPHLTAIRTRGGEGHKLDLRSAVSVSTQSFQNHLVYFFSLYAITLGCCGMLLQSQTKLELPSVQVKTEIKHLLGVKYLYPLRAFWTVFSPAFLVLVSRSIPPSNLLIALLNQC